MAKIDYDYLFRRALMVIPNAGIDSLINEKVRIEYGKKVYTFKFERKYYEYFDGTEILGYLYYWQFNGLQITNKM